MVINLQWEDQIYKRYFENDVTLSAILTKKEYDCFINGKHIALTKDGTILGLSSKIAADETIIIRLVQKEDLAMFCLGEEK